MRYYIFLFFFIFIFFFNSNILSSDNIEFFNRRVYSFNRGIDRVFLNPCTDFYINVCPALIVKKVDNFFINLFDIQTLFLNLLFLNFKNVSKIFPKVVLDTTFGVFGFFSISKFFDLDFKSIALSNTHIFRIFFLKRYILFPFTGPGSINHIFNLCVFQLINPFVYILNNLYFYFFFEFISKKSHMYIDNNFFYTSVLDGYSFLKDIYFQHFYIFDSKKSGD